MSNRHPFRTAVLLAGLVTLIAAPARSEIIEEIVAKVNDEIITKSELDREEQTMMSELYRRYTGDELDEQVKQMRGVLLQTMIDRRLLLHRAGRLYDMEKMEEVILDAFMSQQNIENREELERLLAQEGMTVDDLKRRLLEMRAPEEVIRFEVEDRLAVGDKEVEAYYDEHPEEFTIPAQVMLREIVLLADEDNREERNDEAERVRARAAAEDADFAALARQVSEAGSADQGGEVGPFKKGDMAPVLQEAAFTLPAGEISPVLATEHGFHIIRVESRTEDRKQPLDEIREPLRRRIENEKFAEALNEFLEKARAEATIEISPKYRARYAPGAP